MVWHFYPGSQITSFVTCLIALVIAVKAWGRRPIPGTTPTALFMLLVILWVIAACLEDACDSLPWKLQCENVEFFCFAAVPLLWMALILEYLSHQHLLTRRNVVMVSIVPALSVLLCWTNPLHHVIYSSAVIARLAGVHYLQITYSYGFWFIAAYAYTLLLLGLAVCLIAAASSVGVYRRQAVLLLLGGAVPIVTSVFDISYTILPAWNITPMSFLFTGLTMLWGMHRYQLWNLTFVAYQVMFEKLIDGVLVIDAGHRIIDINLAGCVMFGAIAGELIGQPIEIVLPKLPGFSLRLLREIDEQMIIESAHPGASTYDLRITPLRSPKSRDAGWLIVMRNITKHQQLKEQLYSLAYFDPLTGLPNRMMLQDRLEQALKRGQRTHTSTGVIFLDLDRFKEINDTYGHSVGDDILRQVAARLAQAIRDSDTVSRFGGDEFIFVLSDMADRDALAEVAQRILSSFTAPLSLQGQPFFLTPSMGLTIAPAEGDNMEVLLQNADIAMYRAKDAGGGRYMFFHESLEETTHA